jgi:hypothetical protein
MEEIKIPVLTKLSTEELLEIIEGEKSYSTIFTSTHERRINDREVILERRRKQGYSNETQFRKKSE